MRPLQGALPAARVAMNEPFREAPCAADALQYAAEGWDAFAFAHQSDPAFPDRMAAAEQADANWRSLMDGYTNDQALCCFGDGLPPPIHHPASPSPAFQNQCLAAVYVVPKARPRAALPSADSAAQAWHQRPARALAGPVQGRAARAPPPLHDEPRAILDPPQPMRAERDQ